MIYRDALGLAGTNAKTIEVFRTAAPTSTDRDHALPTKYDRQLMGIQ
jgi:hypothetical protein